MNDSPDQAPQHAPKGQEIGGKGDKQIVFVRLNVAAVQGGVEFADGTPAAIDRQHVRQFMAQHVQVEQGSGEQPAATQHDPDGRAHQGVPDRNGEKNVEAARRVGELVAQGHGRDEGQRQEQEGGHRVPDEPGFPGQVHEREVFVFILPAVGRNLGAVCLVPGVPVALPHHAAEACRGERPAGGFCIPAPVAAFRCVFWCLGHAVERCGFRIAGFPAEGEPNLVLRKRGAKNVL